MSLRVLIVFLIALLALEAEAATVNLLGRSIEVAIPTGYCEIGPHPAEAEIVSRTREAIGNSNQILAMFADCTEREDLRNGNRTMFDNYGLILAQTPNGQLRALKGVSRSEYIRVLSGKLGGKGTSIIEAMKKGETRIKQFDSGAHLDEYLGLLSTDSNGLHVGMLMTLSGDTGKQKPIAGVSGLTVVKEMSISINFYQAYKTSPDFRGLLTHTQSAIASLVRVNN